MPTPECRLVGKPAAAPAALPGRLPTGRARAARELFRRRGLAGAQKTAAAGQDGPRR